MATSLIEKKKYTYEDYLKTPDDKRYELIEGELLMTPSPITNHQRISGRIEFALRKFVSENDLGEVFDAPYDVYLDDENVVQPDICLSLRGGQRLSVKRISRGRRTLWSRSFRKVLLTGTLYRKRSYMLSLG